MGFKDHPCPLISLQKRGQTCSVTYWKGMTVYWEGGGLLKSTFSTVLRWTDLGQKRQKIHVCVCILYDHIGRILFSKLETMSHMSPNDIRRLVWESSCLLGLLFPGCTFAHLLGKKLRKKKIRRRDLNPRRMTRPKKKI